MRLALCGLTGVAVNQLCFFNGLSLTSPVHASLIMTIIPIFVLITSAIILGTAITSRKVIGIALGGIGAITLLFSTPESTSANGPSLIGDILILINALSYGVYLVVVKPLMAKYRPITVISWVFIFGAIFAVPFGVNEVLDIDWSSVIVDDYLVIDCYRLLDPNDFSRVYNDFFVKKYLTALMKRQWGQNLIKFQGVKLPGGVELNGRQLYDDAEKELEIIREQMSNTYEIPPLDFIG